MMDKRLRDPTEGGQTMNDIGDPRLFGDDDNGAPIRLHNDPIEPGRRKIRCYGPEDGEQPERVAALCASTLFY